MITAVVFGSWILTCHFGQACVKSYGGQSGTVTDILKIP